MDRHTSTPSFVVVGGGIAGLAAAEALSRTSASVVVLESRATLGGQWGTDTPDAGGPMEHGPHVLAAWYHNVLELLDLVGAPRAPSPGLAFVRRGGQWSRLHPIRTPRDAIEAWHNRPLPFATLLEYAGFLVSAAARHDGPPPRDERTRADELAVAGLSEDARELDSQVALGSLGVAGPAASARSVARTTALMLRHNSPYMWILSGRTDEVLFEPLRRILEQRGVRLVTGTTVERLDVRDGRIAGVVTTRGETLLADGVVLAAPSAVTSALMRDVAGLGPIAARAATLARRPMGSLEVRFHGSVGGVPIGPICCVGSRFGLAFIDKAQAELGRPTAGHAPAQTWLAVAVAGHDADTPSGEVLDELLAFLGVDRARVAEVRWRTNTDSPLFVNTAGSWHDRPDPATSRPEVAVAGAWVRSPIDVNCLEGATWTGRAAAHALATRFGLAGTRAPITPTTYSPTLLRAVGTSLQRAGRALHRSRRYAR